MPQLRENPFLRAIKDQLLDRTVVRVAIEGELTPNKDGNFLEVLNVQKVIGAWARKKGWKPVTKFSKQEQVLTIIVIK